MKQKSIGINAILNAIKACLSIIFPLITFPYATRILGVDNIGKVNYSQSIEHYFALIAILGITTYAIREGAKLRDNKEKLQAFSNEIFSLNIVTTFFSYVLLILFVFISTKMKEYRLLILLQSLSILFTTIGIDWINTIYEDFLFITIRSILTNILSIVALFLFVKTPNDYYIYAMLSVMTNAVIAISNFFYSRKYTKIKIVFKKSIFTHLKSTIVFFANSLSISIYVNSDVTMLGWMCGDYFVGIYAVAVKVYNIIKTILASIYAVAIPRLSYYYGNNDLLKFKELFTNIVMYLSLLILPCMAGLIGVSKEVVLILSGNEYIEAMHTLQILSVALLFAIFGGAITNCLNIPFKKELINMKATLISAIANVVLNLYFIPTFKQNGAAITSVISEIIVLLICFLSFKEWQKVLNVKLVVKNFGQSVIGMLFIGLGCYIVELINIDNSIISLGIKVLMSIFVYSVILIILKNQCLITIFNKFKEKRYGKSNCNSAKL